MSSEGQPPIGSLNGLCGAGCLVCRDCRQGVYFLFENCAPVAGSYTIKTDATETAFTIAADSVSFVHAVSSPLYLGQYANENGHIYLQCCERYVGTFRATWTPPGFAEIENDFFFVSVGISPHGCYVRADAYTSSVYFFKRAFDEPPSDAESALCSIKKHEYTEIFNTPESSYDAGVSYILDNESLSVSIIPVYCNDDSSYSNIGSGTSSQNEDDFDAKCQCNDCTGPSTYKLTISGLQSQCVNFMIPTVDSVEIEFTVPDENICYPYLVESPGIWSTVATGSTEECGEDPEYFDQFCDGDPSLEKTFKIESLVVMGGIEPPDGRVVKVYLYIYLYCDGEGLNDWVGIVSFDFHWACNGGIVSEAITDIDIEYVNGSSAITGGVLTVEIEPV